MKISVVPAQITTVEDRIAGNLNFTQVLLLTTPLLAVVIIFILIPPLGHFSIFKLVFSALIIGCSSSLAIRIGNKILLDIIKLRLTYLTRPHIYVYKKRSDYIDVNYVPNIYRSRGTKSRNVTSTVLSKPETIRGYKLLANNQYSVLFKTKAGGLSVEVTNLK